MVQRKDSLSFVEFLRGKYDVNNTQYLLKLFTNMTEEERARIESNDFETLWKEMWCKSIVQESNKNFTKEYNDSKEKFETLKKGVYIKSVTKGIYFFDIQYILSNSSSEFDETEWGFPKGRRNINEDDVHCALREFREETGISPRNIRVCYDIKPLEEVFSGTNKIRYKHVYYVARNSVNNTFGGKDESTPPISPNNIEIKDIKWFDYNEAQNKIRKLNVERRELFKRLNNIIVRSIREV
jgi:8-oxo-dGTP pyrophosphatase MutT (NUDIX family)